MKLPFSYKNNPQVFRSIFAASVITHAVLLGGAGIFMSTPEYAVERAPSSMEIVMIEERKPEPKPVEVPQPDLETVQKQMLPKPEEVKPRLSETQAVQKGAVTEAKPAHLKNPAPAYPRIARQNAWEGVVMLKVLVSADGRVESIAVEKSSGYDVLDESAVKAIGQWRFLPARMGKVQFDSWIRIPIRFILTEED